MRASPWRQVSILVLALVVGIAWCLVAAPLTDGDPMLVLEFGSGTVATIWGAILIRNLVRGHRLARELKSLSDTQTIEGVSVRVVVGGGRMAFVLGAFTPTIFVGDELLGILADDERTAVLFHEEHHRSTRAPIRSAAVEAWISVLGRWDVVRSLLLDRLADLEHAADQYAIDRGCSPSSLAAALIKADPTPLGLSAYSYAADRRIRGLLQTYRGPARGAHRLPYEWLPVAVVSLMAAACHLWGLSPLI